MQTSIDPLKTLETWCLIPKRLNLLTFQTPKSAGIIMLNLMPTPILIGILFKAARKGCEMRERTAVKVARFVPGRGENGNTFPLFNIRNGTANIFMAVEFKAGKRVTQVTERRTMIDFAQFMKALVIDEYLETEVVRVITDNLNIHKEKSFYETFSEDEAEKILEKIEFHYTPKHASWLNAAEIEISVMDEECTDRRIADIGMLTNEVATWTKRRNENKKKINWTFTKKIADEKMSKYYVS